MSSHWDLKQVQSLSFEALVGFYHDLVDRDVVDDPKLNRVLHRLIQFSSVHPFRRGDNWWSPAPLIFRKLDNGSFLTSEGLILQDLQMEKKAIFQLALYYFSLPRLPPDVTTDAHMQVKGELLETPIGELQSTNAPNFIWRWLHDEGYDAINCSALLTLTNLMEHRDLELDQMPKMLENLQRFLSTPIDLQIFKQELELDLLEHDQWF